MKICQNFNLQYKKNFDNKKKIQNNQTNISNCQTKNFGRNILTAYPPIIPKIPEIKLKYAQLEKLIGKKLTEEQYNNPNLRENIDLALRFYTIHKSHDDVVLRGLCEHPFPDILPESMDDFDCDNVIYRLCLLGFPLKLADLSYRVKKGIVGCDEFTPELNLGDDIEYGKDCVRWYQRNTRESGEVNNALRYSQPLTEDAQKLINFFDTHQRPLGKNMGLIRGTEDYPQMNFSKLKKGDKFIDKGYMSTMNPKGIEQVLDSFDDGFGDFTHFLVIQALATQNVIVPADWTKVDNMGEIILPRNTKFRVIDNVPLDDYGTGLIPPKKGRRAVIVEIVN